MALNRLLRSALLVLLLPGAAVATDEDGAEEETQAELVAQAEARRAFALGAAGLAPFGVPDSSTLPKGGFAFSYRYTRVHGDDIRDRESRKSDWEVLQKWESTPNKRDRDVHRIGVAYAPHRRLTLSAQLPVVAVKTRSVRRDPSAKYTNRATGVGDLQLRILIPFMRKDDESLQVEMGLTAPTGSITKRGRDGAGGRSKLPFPQQLGSGTVDLLPGVVYRGYWESLSWGFVARGVVRLYDNRRDYRLGNEYALSAWISQTWTDWLSMSLRTTWANQANISSSERNASNPAREPKRQQGATFEIGPGVNFRLPFLGDPRFGVEMSWPVYQRLDGPQVERDWTFTAGWEWQF